MNMHDEVEPRKVLKSSGQKNLQSIFAKYSIRNFCRSSKKGQRQPGEQEWTFTFLFRYLKIISQFCATPPMHIYARIRKGKLLGSGPPPTKDGVKVDSETKCTEK